MPEVSTETSNGRPANSKTAVDKLSINRRSSGNSTYVEEVLDQNQAISTTPIVVSQTARPVIVGVAHYKGSIPVDGVVVGKADDDGGSLEIARPRPRPNEPELSGALSFEDVVQINGHIAGSVYSKSGTLLWVPTQ